MAATLVEVGSGSGFGIGDEPNLTKKKILYYPSVLDPLGALLSVTLLRHRRKRWRRFVYILALHVSSRFETSHVVGGGGVPHSRIGVEGLLADVGGGGAARCLIQTLASKVQHVLH